MNRTQLPEVCVKVHCQGYENSLAECVISNKAVIKDSVAVVSCYDSKKGLVALMLTKSPLLKLGILAKLATKKKKKPKQYKTLLMVCLKRVKD